MPKRDTEQLMPHENTALDSTRNVARTCRTGTLCKSITHKNTLPLSTLVSKQLCEFFIQHFNGKKSTGMQLMVNGG